MVNEVSTQPDKDQLLALYRQMLVIRRCDEQLAQSYQAGLIPGGCHTYVGEEAIATGVCAHLRRDDAVFSTHRGHGHALAQGVSVRQIIAELYGKASGCSRGRGGSMHLFAPEVGLNGAHVPTPYSPPLEASVLPQPESIAQAIRDLKAER